MTLTVPDGQWRSAGRTNVGKVRKHNEDALVDRSDLGLWAVADGMGGHQRGEVASELLCSELSTLGASLSLADAVDVIDESTLSVNDRLLDMAEQLDAGAVIGCTLVALVVRGAYAACLWAGDSRLYRLRAGHLVLLSEDHCPQNETGVPGDTVASVKTNYITRAVGADVNLYLDVDSFEVQKRDRYLLCSDGLSDEVSSGGIASIMSRGTCEEAADRLVAEALENGGRDNITAVVAEYR